MKGLVFDDEDVGSDLIGDLAACLVDQARHIALRNRKRSRDLSTRKAFQRAKQKRDPGTERNRIEIALDTGFLSGSRPVHMPVHRHGLPDLQEDAVQLGAKLRPFLDGPRLGDDALERSQHIGVTALLVARQCAGEPAKIRDLGRNRLGNRHKHLVKLKLPSCRCNAQRQ